MIFMGFLFDKVDGETTKASEDESPDDVHDRGGGFVEDQGCYVRTGEQERHEGEVSVVGVKALLIIATFPDQVY